MLPWIRTAATAHGAASNLCAAGGAARGRGDPGYSRLMPRGSRRPMPSASA